MITAQSARRSSQACTKRITLLINSRAGCTLDCKRTIRRGKSDQSGDEEESGSGPARDRSQQCGERGRDEMLHKLAARDDYSLRSFNFAPGRQPDEGELHDDFVVGFGTRNEITR